MKLNELETRQKISSISQDKEYYKTKVNSLNERIAKHKSEIEKVEKEKENLSNLLRAA